MELRRGLCLALAAIGIVLVSGSPARSASRSCGSGGYAYAGLEARRNAFGVAATLTATSEPLVESGHVAAWIGVGAPGEGPNGSDEWLQVGLNTIAGNPGKLYYEVAQPTGIKYFELRPNVPAGRRYNVAVTEIPGRANVWRVWVNGRAASRPIWLPQSHLSLTPMAIAESWDGGASACNRYRYRFGRVALARAPGGSWTPFRRRAASVMQDRGSRVVSAPRGGFVAVTAPAPPPLRPIRPPQRTPATVQSSAPSHASPG